MGPVSMNTSQVVRTCASFAVRTRPPVKLREKTIFRTIRVDGRGRVSVASKRSKRSRADAFTLHDSQASLLIMEGNLYLP